MLLIHSPSATLLIQVVIDVLRLATDGIQVTTNVSCY